MKNQANATQFFYQNEKLITVSQGAQKRAIFRYADVPLAELHTDLKASATRVSTDESGSVLGMSSEVETAALAYAAYGHHAAKTRMLSLLRFNGQYRTDEGHYLLGNGYRSYSPALMRFYSPDSLSPFQAGGLNSYSYCLGDPVNQTDPTGHKSLFKPSTWFSTRESRITKRINQVATTRKRLQKSRSKVLQMNKEISTTESIKSIKQLNNEISNDSTYLIKKLKNLKKHKRAPAESPEQTAIRHEYKAYQNASKQLINRLEMQSTQSNSPMNILNNREIREDQDSYYIKEERQRAQPLQAKNKHTRQI